MPILLVILGFFFPRAVIFCLWIFTSWFSGVFDGWLIPLLGFFFMPFTLFWYAITIHYYGGDWSGIPTIGMVIAVLLDLGVIGKGAKSRS